MVGSRGLPIIQIWNFGGNGWALNPERDFDDWEMGDCAHLLQKINGVRPTDLRDDILTSEN